MVPLRRVLATHMPAWVLMAQVVGKTSTSLRCRADGSFYDKRIRGGEWERKRSSKEYADMGGLLPTLGHGDVKTGLLPRIIWGIRELGNFRWFSRISLRGSFLLWAPG